MRGRFTQIASPQIIAQQFANTNPPPFTPQETNEDIRTVRGAGITQLLRLHPTVCKAAAIDFVVKKVIER